jgi:hypothetical protein
MPVEGQKRPLWRPTPAPLQQPGSATGPLMRLNVRIQRQHDCTCWHRVQSMPTPPALHQQGLKLRQSSAQNRSCAESKAGTRAWSDVDTVETATMAVRREDTLCMTHENVANTELSARWK